MEVKRLVREVAFKDGLLGKNRTDSLHAKLLAADCPEFNQSQPKSVKTWKARNHKAASTSNLLKAPGHAAQSQVDLFRMDALEKAKTDGCHIFKSTKSKLAATSKAKTGPHLADNSRSRARTVKLESKLACEKAPRDTPQRAAPNFADFERNQRSHSAPQRNSTEEKTQGVYFMAAVPAKGPSEVQKLHITLKEPSFSRGMPD